MRKEWGGGYFERGIRIRIALLQYEKIMEYQHYHLLKKEKWNPQICWGDWGGTDKEDQNFQNFLAQNPDHNT